MSTRAEQYRQYAADCLRVARRTNNAADKNLMLEMTQKWRELADKAGRAGNSEMMTGPDAKRVGSVFAEPPTGET